MSFRDKTDWLRRKAKEIVVHETGTVEVFVADDSKAKALSERLRLMSDTIINAVFQPLAAFFGGRRPVIVDSQGKSTGAGADMVGISKENFEKVPLPVKQLLLANFWGEPRNLNRLKDALSEKERNLIDAEVHDFYVSDERALKIMGKDYPSLMKNRKSPSSPFFFEHMSDVDKTCRRYFSLHHVVRNFLLRSMYDEKELLSHSLEVLPEDDDLLIFSGEDDIFGILRYTQSIGECVFDFDNYSGMSLQKRRKASGLLNINEFFSDSPVCDDLTQRAFMIFEMYSLHRSAKDAPRDDIKHFLEAMFCKVDNVYGIVMSQMFLCHIKGLTSEQLVLSYVEDFLGMIQKVLLRMGEMRWMEMGDFRMLIRLMEEKTSYSSIFRFHGFDSMRLTNTRTGELIRHDMTLSQLTTPFIQGYMFLLAAVGLVEIAYREPRQGDVSCYSGLRYVRLTHLGCYILGFEKEYSRLEHAAEGRHWFEAEPDCLMVRSMSPDNPFTSLIEGVSKNIGGGRYMVTAESLLKTCASCGEMQKRIEMIKTLVGQNLPDIWTQFFDGLKAKMGCITEGDVSQYEIWDISPDARELQRIISSDSLLRKYTLRADNCMLMVDMSHKDDVIKRLKSYGYLPGV